MNHRYLEVIILGLVVCLAGTAANAQQNTAPAPQFPAGMQGAQPAAAPVPVPQALGPKAAGKIRIGVAPAVAQMGQGNNAQADFGTPIRNSLVLIMGGPAVEITPLDSHLPIQVQAEAQQKQCDYILYSAVEVKHSSGGGLAGFMKKAAPITNMTPIGMMAKAGTMAATAQAAAQMATMSAQQQAVNQLAQFNGQIKSKDDVSIVYQLFPTGQDKAKLENTLKGKAKNDGEDVLTPLMQQAANTILTEVTKPQTQAPAK
jgi:hypothetical protein